MDFKNKSKTDKDRKNLIEKKYKNLFQTNKDIFISELINSVKKNNKEEVEIVLEHKKYYKLIDKNRQKDGKRIIDIAFYNDLYDIAEIIRAKRVEYASKYGIYTRGLDLTMTKLDKSAKCGKIELKDENIHLASLRIPCYTTEDSYEFWGVLTGKLKTI